MYIKLTPKQLAVLKKLLPTVKLNAYDIEIYQEIQNALMSPVEDIGKSVKYSSEPKKSDAPKPQFKPPNKPKQEPPKSKPPEMKELKDEVDDQINYDEKLDYLEGLKKDKRPDLISDTKEEIEEVEEVQEESIFSVIDNRTQKPL